MDAIVLYKSEGDYKKGLFVRNVVFQNLTKEKIKISFDIEKVMDENFFKAKEIQFFSDDEIRFTFYNFDSLTNIASRDITREIGNQLFSIEIEREITEEEYLKFLEKEE